MPLTLTDQEVVQLRSTALFIESSLDTLMTDETIPDLLRGIVMGAFIGVPTRLKETIAMLEPGDE